MKCEQGRGMRGTGLGVVLAAALMVGCGDDPLRREYQGTFRLAAQLSTGPRELEGPLTVDFSVLVDNDANLYLRGQLCVLAANYIGDISEPGGDGGKNEYEELRDLRPDQSLVCPMPPEGADGLNLDFRLGTGRIDNEQLTFTLRGDVWRESSPEAADARAERVGTFTYTFAGDEVR